MSCCPPYGHDEFFGERMARRDARRFRRRGLDGDARRVVEFLRGRGVAGASVLEIGGGVGAIQLELLAAGAARAANVELASAYEEDALALARERDVEVRVERRLFDFAAAPEEVEPADFVVLHKVVCCYPDHRALVGAAARHARRALVLTFPRDEWWTRAALGAVNVLQRLRRQAFRTYVHPPAAIRAVAREHGLAPAEARTGAFWLFEAFARA